MFSIISKRKECIRNDLLSGLTVALALVPEAVAFALLAHLHPLTGLYAAFVVGLIAAIVGGRPGMISGATGAIAVVVGSLVLQHGEEYLFAAVMMMGLIQITFGILRLGKFIRLVPHPVFLGFVNGLALVIFIAQFQHFKISAPDGSHEEHDEVDEIVDPPPLGTEEVGKTFLPVIGVAEHRRQTKHGDDENENGLADPSQSHLESLDGQGGALDGARVAQTRGENGKTRQ